MLNIWDILIRLFTFGNVDLLDVNGDVNDMTIHHVFILMISLMTWFVCYHIIRKVVKK
jgi:hypothetical protein